MEQQETRQAIWRYKTESKIPEIIFSTLEHLIKQPRKELFQQKKRRKKKKERRKKEKQGGFFQEAGQGTNQIWLLPMG